MTAYIYLTFLYTEVRAVFQIMFVWQSLFAKANSVKKKKKRKKEERKKKTFFKICESVLMIQKRDLHFK